MLSPTFLQTFLTGRKFLLVSLCMVIGAGAIPGSLYTANAQAPEIKELLPEPGDGIAAPSAGALSSSQEAAAQSSDTQSIEIPSISASTEPDENLFYDAESLVPTGEMSTGAPRKVNPKLQPGSRLIVVKKNAHASSKAAQLVSAQRAMKLGRYDAALDMYDQLYMKNKRDPRILMGRAVSLQHLGRFEAAMLAYEALTNVQPKNTEAKVNMLGLLGTKYPSVALRQLLDLRVDYPSHTGIAAQIAVTEARLGNFESAMRYLGIAASMEPDNASHIFNMAVVADRAGKKGKAVQYYEQALELDSIYGRGQSIPRESVYERLANLR